MTDDDPRLRTLDRVRPLTGRGSVAVTVAAAAVLVVAAVTFAVGLAADAPLEVYGTALATALVAAAFILRRLLFATYPLVDVAEPRSTGHASDEPLADVEPLPRRRWLTRALVATGAVFGLSLLAPVSALGPRRLDVDRSSAWRAGTRLVDTRGRPLRPTDVPGGGLSTVWPDSGGDDDTDAIVLVRLSVPPVPPTRLDWVVDGQLLAYSKICTHLGCPVGLFQEGQGTLFCPCHQQSFDAAEGARPTYGPAARPLAQLPLGVDDEGFLVALGDFEAPVGPAVG